MLCNISRILFITELVFSGYFSGDLKHSLDQYFTEGTTFLM